MSNGKMVRAWGVRILLAFCLIPCFCSGLTGQDVRKSIVKVKSTFHSQSFVRPWEKPYHSVQPEIYKRESAYAAGFCINEIVVNGQIFRVRMVRKINNL